MSPLMLPSNRIDVSLFWLKSQLNANFCMHRTFYMDCMRSALWFLKRNAASFETVVNRLSATSSNKLILKWISMGRKLTICSIQMGIDQFTIFVLAEHFFQFTNGFFILGDSFKLTHNFWVVLRCKLSVAWGLLTNKFLDHLLNSYD